MENVKFVYFDLDDTLLDHHHAQEQALQACHAHFLELNQIPLGQLQKRYHERNVVLWKAYARDELTKDELNLSRFQDTLDVLSIGGLIAEDFRDFYLDAYSMHWKYVDGALTAFEAIADRFPVGILTNGFVEIQEHKLARFPELRDRSSAIVISEAFGKLKPHPDLFKYAAKKSGVHRSEILYVGDSWNSDVQGGQRAGWNVAWYLRHPPSGSIPANLFAFDDWDELLKALLNSRRDHPAS